MTAPAAERCICGEPLPCGTCTRRAWLCAVCSVRVPDGDSVCTACASKLAPVARAGIEAVTHGNMEAEADRAFADAMFGTKPSMPYVYGPVTKVRVVE